MDTIYKTHRRRATLTEAGHRILVAFLGLLTDLWNGGLEEHQDAYRKTGKSPSFHDQCRSLTEIRKENPEIAAFNACALRAPLSRLHKAFLRRDRNATDGIRATSRRFGAVAVELTRHGQE